MKPVAASATSPIAVTKAAATTTATVVSKSGGGGQAPKGSRLKQYLKAPYRTLVMTRDLYVSCFTGCAGRTHYGPMMSNTGGRMSGAGGYSFSSSRRTYGDEDVRELIHAQLRDMKASSLQAGGVAKVADGNVGSAAVGRTQCAMPAIGRIDEDQPMEFEGDVVVVDKDGGSGVGFRPRSLSFAVVSRSDSRTIRAD